MKRALEAAQLVSWDELSTARGHGSMVIEILPEMVSSDPTLRSSASLDMLQVIGSGPLPSVAGPVTKVLLDLLACDDVPEPRLLLGVLGHIAWTAKASEPASPPSLRDEVRRRVAEVTRHASKDAHTAAMAGYVLSALPSPSADWIDIVTPSLAGPPPTAATGALALGWLCRTLDPSEQPAAIAALTPALTNADALVRGAAATALVLVRNAIPDALRPSLRDALSAPRVTDELAEEVGACLAFPWGGGSLPIACAFVFQTLRDPIRDAAAELLIEALASAAPRPHAPNQPF